MEKIPEKVNKVFYWDFEFPELFDRVCVEVFEGKEILLKLRFLNYPILNKNSYFLYLPKTILVRMN